MEGSAIVKIDLLRHDSLRIQNILLVLLCLSIGSTFTISNFSIEGWLSATVHSYRFLLPFLILPILLFLIATNPKLRPTALETALSSYLLIQIYPFFVFRTISFEEIQLIVASFSLIGIIYLNRVTGSLMPSNRQINPMFCGICNVLIVLTFMYFFFFFNDLWISINQNLLSGYYVFTEVEGQTFIPPRATGMARTAVVLFASSVIAGALVGSLRPLILMVATVSAFGLFYYQSRGGFVLFIVFFFLLLFDHFFISKKSEQSKLAIKIFAKTLVFAVLLFLVYNISFFLKQLWRTKNPIDWFDANAFGVNRFAVMDLFGLDRLTIWFDCLKLWLVNPFLGFGLQADRFYLETSAHNSLVYIFLTTGMVGAVAWLLMLFGTFYEGRQSGWHNKSFGKKICFVFVTLLFIRGGFETGSAVFGIDFILFFLSLAFLGLCSASKCRQNTV